MRALGRQAEQRRARSPSPRRARISRRRQRAARRRARRGRAARRRCARGSSPSSSTRSSRVLCESTITRSRAAGGGRHEHAHALVAQAGVRLGEARVDQVVDRRDDAREAPAQRRRAGEAVHEVDARARGQPRQQRLLAEHPLHAAARVHGHRHRRQQLAPRPAAGGGRLAVDERREARRLAGACATSAGISSRAATSIPPVSPGTRKIRFRPTCTVMPGMRGTATASCPDACTLYSSSRYLTIGIDARAAAEVPAGAAGSCASCCARSAARAERRRTATCCYARERWPTSRSTSASRGG